MDHNLFFKNANICDLYKENKIVRIVFCYTFSYGDGELNKERVKCEINCQKTFENISYTYKGPLYSVYEDCRNLYSNSISEEEISNFLNCIFRKYDLRFLNSDALETHPSIICNGFEEGSDSYSIRIDYIDDDYDEVFFERDSIAYNLVKTFMPRPSFLEMVF